MKYKGKLYGRIGMKNFDTGRTTEDWDRMENALKVISTWAVADSDSRQSRRSAMDDIERKANRALSR